MTSIPRRTKLILSSLSFTGDRLGPHYEFTFTVAGQTATIKVNMKQRREATGEVTAGCATVDAVESWDKICKALLRSRLDSQTVGTLEVLP
jgi:hypothetical protein